MDATLFVRGEELRRRVNALPTEIEAWIERSRKELDLNAHHSQLNALRVLMNALLAPHQARVEKLSPDNTAFLDECFQVVQEITAIQRVWDFFRDKLELRFSPDFKEPLWVADSVAWSCHRPVLDEAIAAQLVNPDEVREPPLVYLSADSSLATWVRGSRPTDPKRGPLLLGVTTLPIPVIEMPWDHIVNVWEFLTLHHEVGHDIEADLRLRPDLQLSLQQALQNANVSAERVQIWRSWLGEMFADLVALQLAGPAFAEGLMHLLLLPRTNVVTYKPIDSHPTHYVRILMNAAYVPTLIRPQQDDPPAVMAIHQRLVNDANGIAARWKSIYGEPDEFWAPFLSDFDLVFTALMDAPLAVLQGKTVRDLMPYKPADDLRIRDVANYLRTGYNAPAPLSIAPRHCASAARLAVSSSTPDDPDFPSTLRKIHERTIQLVRDNTAPGLRATQDSVAHRKFIESFAAILRPEVHLP